MSKITIRTRIPLIVIACLLSGVLKHNFWQINKACLLHYNLYKEEITCTSLTTIKSNIWDSIISTKPDHTNVIINNVCTYKKIINVKNM